MKLKTAAVLLASAAAFALSAAPEITITTERAVPRYRCGEEAVFVVSAKENGRPAKGGKMTLELTLGGGRSLLKQPIDFSAANPAKVAITLDEPGFVLARGIGSEGTRKPGKAPLCGAAFDPEKIQLGFEPPEDFREFWEDGRRRIADREVKLTELGKLSTARYTAYRVDVEALDGGHLYGYLTVPKGRGPFPAVLTVPGAGPGKAAVDRAYADKGVITAVMNVHGFFADDAAGQRRLYDELNKRGLYYMTNPDSRDRYFFRNVILGVDRVVNHIASMPEWDGKHFVYYGSSQGGGMGLILAGFNPRITAIAVNVPALCDHGGYKFGRQPGWPRLVGGVAEREKVAPYFDAGNFARFISVPVLASAGYIDTTCPPSSVYAAFNQIKSPKKMVDMPGTGHSIPKHWLAVQNPWIMGQLGLGPAHEPKAK